MLFVVYLTFIVKHDILSNVMVDRMRLEDIERYNRLLEIYGGLLSDKARDLLTDYIRYGLSITEIADLRKVSKQSVSLTLRRALKKLNTLEKHIGMLELITLLEKECYEVLEKWERQRGDRVV